MKAPKFEELTAASIAGMLIGTTCYLLIVGMEVSSALWAADGAVTGYYLRGRVEKPTP